MCFTRISSFDKATQITFFTKKNNKDNVYNVDTFQLTEMLVTQLHSYAIFEKQKHWHDNNFETRTEYFLAGMSQKCWGRGGDHSTGNQVPTFCSFY
jgi:hypothetical protein